MMKESQILEKGFLMPRSSSVFKIENETGIIGIIIFWGIID